MLSSMTNFVQVCVWFFLRQDGNHVEELRSQWEQVFWITAGLNIFGALVFAAMASGEVQPWAMPAQSDTTTNASSTLERSTIDRRGFDDLSKVPIISLVGHGQSVRKPGDVTIFSNSPNCSPPVEQVDVGTEPSLSKTVYRAVNRKEVLEFDLGFEEIPNVLVEDDASTSSTSSHDCNTPGLCVQVVSQSMCNPSNCSSSQLTSKSANGTSNGSSSHQRENNKNMTCHTSNRGQRSILYI